MSEIPDSKKFHVVPYTSCSDCAFAIEDCTHINCRSRSVIFVTVAPPPKPATSMQDELAKLTRMVEVLVEHLSKEDCEVCPLYGDVPCKRATCSSAIRTWAENKAKEKVS